MSRPCACVTLASLCPGLAFVPLAWEQRVIHVQTLEGVPLLPRRSVSVRLPSYWRKIKDAISGLGVPGALRIPPTPPCTWAEWGCWLLSVRVGFGGSPCAVNADVVSSSGSECPKLCSESASETANM